MSDVSDQDGDRAAEFALGSLDMQEMHRFELRMRDDPLLAAEVAQWADRLSGVMDSVPPLAPPAKALRGAKAALFGQQRRTRLPRFGWKTFVVGIVVFKLALVSAWWVTRPATLPEPPPVASPIP